MMRDYRIDFFALCSFFDDFFCLKLLDQNSAKIIIMLSKLFQREVSFFCHKYKCKYKLKLKFLTDILMFIQEKFSTENIVGAGFSFLVPFAKSVWNEPSFGFVPTWFVKSTDQRDLGMKVFL